MYGTKNITLEIDYYIPDGNMAFTQDFNKVKRNIERHSPEFRNGIKEYFTPSALHLALLVAVPLGKYVSLISIDSGQQSGRMVIADYTIPNKKAQVRKVFAAAFNEETADLFMEKYLFFKSKPHIFPHKILLTHHPLIDDGN